MCYIPTGAGTGKEDFNNELSNLCIFNCKVIEKYNDSVLQLFQKEEADIWKTILAK